MLGHFAPKTMFLGTKGPSIGRFDWLFLPLYQLSADEAKMLQELSVSLLSCVRSFCLQKRMFLRTKRLSISWFD